MLEETSKSMISPTEEGPWLFGISVTINFFFFFIGDLGNRFVLKFHLNEDKLSHMKVRLLVTGFIWSNVVKVS